MIAIVYPQFYGVGGIARYLDSFLENLPENSRRIILITGDEHAQERSYRGVEIKHVPFSSSRLNLFLWGWKVRRILRDLHRRSGLRAVNFHFPPLIPGLFLPTGVPIILTAHTTYLGMSGRFYPVAHYESQWKGISLWIKMWMERRIFSKVAKVITLTEQGRQEVLSYGFKGPIAVVPNGADVDKFSPGLSAEKTVDVLFSGRIELRKGSRAMVALCQALVAVKPNIRICIVGYGDDEEWVKAHLQPYTNNVHLAGKVPFAEMMQYYNRSRVYASTSFYEGLPGTCLEAMAMKLPVVVWDFLFYRGLVMEGETGCLVPPNDFSAASRAVLDLLDNNELCRRMGENGRELLIKQFNWRLLSRHIVAEMLGVEYA